MTATKETSKKEVAYFEGLSGYVVHETEKAYLLDINCENGFPKYPEIWIPKKITRNFDVDSTFKSPITFKGDIAKWIFIKWKQDFNTRHKVGEHFKGKRYSRKRRIIKVNI